MSDKIIYCKSTIMKRAWELFHLFRGHKRSNKRKFFASMLKDAWQEARMPIKTPQIFTEAETQALMIRCKEKLNAGDYAALKQLECA